MLLNFFSEYLCYVKLKNSEKILIHHSNEPLRHSYLNLNCHCLIFHLGHHHKMKISINDASGNGYVTIEYIKQGYSVMLSVATYIMHKCSPDTD